MNLSRLGPHTILSTPDALEWAKRAPVVKTVNSRLALQEAPWHAIRVYRHWWPETAQDEILTARDADRVVAGILTGLDGYRHPLLYVEVLNEVRKHRINDYIALLAKVVPKLHSAMLKVAGPSWSTGDYEQADWDAFRMVRWAGLDAISLHAYWGNQGFTPWHALRYRSYWDPTKDPALVLVTECGRDRVEGGLGGWRADGLAPERYLAELAAYDAEIARDRTVYATPFTAGPTPDWERFSTDPITGALAAASTPPTAAPGPFPTPTDPPKESPVNPWRGKILTVWNLPADPNELIRVCRALAVDGVEVKVADGASSWIDRRNVTDRYVRALKEAGLRVLGWSYNYCDLLRGQPERGDGVPEMESDAALVAVQSLGLDGYTFDLEIECEGHGDLVSIMLDRARKTLGVPIAAHVWADLRGHGGYPAVEILRYVDVLRPMIYRPVWNAARCWESWGALFAGDPPVICPVWGLTEGTPAEIRADMAVADANGCPGEAYWELAAVRSGTGPLIDLVRARAIGDTATGPDPNVVACFDRCWEATLDLAAVNEAAARVIQWYLAEAKVELGLQEAA